MKKKLINKTKSSLNKNKKKINNSSLIKNQDFSDVFFVDALSERYLSYALSTITSRSLPDVRDGFKPVHRRLLFAMRELKLDPKSGFKKCARVVGDVIGKYHPHGEQAVYDSLVRLAQNFASRYPLIDGQGNFGNVDGDNAAAMRYTEARLTNVAETMMEGIEENSVDFRENYDGSEKEPIVMPASFPNLLANGSSGIAVGMATNIPPHNVSEICDGLLHLIKYPKASHKKLLKFIKGPDFPTGGILLETKEALEKIYSTGKGGMRVRAKWEIENLNNGGWQLVITELPYLVQKAKLIERIAEMMNSKKLVMLDDIRDESAEDVRIVFIPRSKQINSEQFAEFLFNNTDLEVRFHLNMNVLENGKTPKLMNLREVLQSFLDHRHQVLIRRSKFQLNKIEMRMEVLKGYLVAYLNIDKIIRIIRKNDEPKPFLLKIFKLSEIQAESILNMRLRALRKLEENHIQNEYEKIATEAKKIRGILKSVEKRWRSIANEISFISKNFGKESEIGARLTSIESKKEPIHIEMNSLIEKEQISIICSSKGWIKAIKGHGEPSKDMKYKEGDKARFWIHGETTDKLILFATNGRFYTIQCDRISRGRGYGEPLRLFVDLPNDEEILSIFINVPNSKILVVSEDGRGFVVLEENVVAQTKNGKQILNLKKEIKAAVCTPAEGDHIALIGSNRKLIIFPISEIPELPRGRGITLQRYREGIVSDAICFFKNEGLHWHSGNRVHNQTEILDWLGKRGNAGRIAPRGFPRNNRFTL